MFFMMFYVLSIVFTVSCSDWFLIWVGLEINMISFIALIYDRSSNSVEASMKYFFIQSLGSGILLMLFLAKFSMFDLVSVSVLSYKVGAGPFYYWFPPVCDSIGWGGCLMLMTFQKILPLLLMSFMANSFMWIIIVMSLMIGVMGSFNQKSLKRLMAFSSIHHIGWIMVGNFINSDMWFIYLEVYMALISGIVLSLWKDKALEMGMLKSVSSKWTFVIGMLSMGGMPPMLGFYLKWYLFMNFLMVDTFILLMMILTSVLMFYVYLRIVFSLMMGSFFIWGWNYSLTTTNLVSSMDMFYIMGVSVGPLIWFMV